MLTRDDGTQVTADNLTDEDVALSPWNVLDDLDCEEEIMGHLQAAILDIEEGECDPGFFIVALADAAKARAINQLAKEMGIDRSEVRRMLDKGRDGKGTAFTKDLMTRVAKSFEVPALV